MKLDSLGIQENIRKSLRLTERDIQILQLMADSYYERDIAAHFKISLSRFKNVKRAMYNKIGAECAAHAVAQGFRKGLIE